VTSSWFFIPQQKLEFETKTKKEGAKDDYSRISTAYSLYTTLYNMHFRNSVSAIALEIRQKYPNRFVSFPLSRTGHLLSHKRSNNSTYPNKADQ